MKYEIKGEFGDYLEIDMEKGDKFYAEPSALVMIDGDVEVNPKMQGGIGGALLRSLGGGESLFINEITANNNSKIQIAGTTIGKIHKFELDGEYTLGDGVYLAHIGDISLTSKFGGLNSLAMGSGLFILKASGKGTIFLETHGNVIERELKEGETITVDNGNFVAADSKVDIQKKFIGKGLKGKLFSGEGLMMVLTGPGKVIYQTHSTINLVKQILKRLRG